MSGLRSVSSWFRGGKHRGLNRPRHARHAVVGYDHVKDSGGKLIEPVLAPGSRSHRVALLLQNAAPRD